MKILLILNKNKKLNQFIINRTKTIFKKVTVVYDHDTTFFNKKHSFDYTFSFLSKRILTKKFLDNTKFLNINFHPGPPEYPGIGCYNFALYNGEAYYGCTVHEMNEKIDSGKIIAVNKFKINERNIGSLISQTYAEMKKQYIHTLKLVKKNKFFFNEKIKWSKNLKTRKDLNKLAEINIGMEKKEIIRRIAATHYKRGHGPFLKIKNLKFEFIND